MKLHEMKRPKIKKNKKRLGKGQGSGQGTYAGKGLKGQKARSGGGIPNWFEGGQMPIHRRVPKFGFTNIFKVPFRVINLYDLAKIEDKDVDISILENNGLLPTKGKKKNLPVKLLANGKEDFKKKINIKINAISKAAKKIIEDNGGKVEIV